MSIPIYGFGVGPIGAGGVPQEIEISLSDNREDLPTEITDNTESITFVVECKD